MAANDPTQPAPYVASNQYSVFTGFDSGTGVVSSWMFDGAAEDPEIILLDEFTLGSDENPEPGPVAGKSSLTSSGSSFSGVFALIGDIGGAIAEFFRRLF